MLSCEYDKFASFYDDFALGYDEDSKFFLSKAQEMSARNILELCSGTGRCCLFLAKGGFKVSGIDSSPEMIRIANKKLQSAATAKGRFCRPRYYLQNVAEFDLTTKNFDLAFSTWSSLQHLNLRERQNCYIKVHQHLRERGWLIIDESLRTEEELSGHSKKHFLWKIRPCFLKRGKIYLQYYYDEYDSGGKALKRTFCQDILLPFVPTNRALDVVRRTVYMEFIQPEKNENERMLADAGFQIKEYIYRDNSVGTSNERFYLIAEKISA